MEEVDHSSKELIYEVECEILSQVWDLMSLSQWAFKKVL